jgi:hypothetical protein
MLYDLGIYAMVSLFSSTALSVELRQKLDQIRGCFLDRIIPHKASWQTLK